MAQDMGPNFSPVIAYSGDQVFAMGPLGSDDNGIADKVEELRAWIYQPKSFTVNVPGANEPALLWSPNDAAANSVDDSQLRQNPGVCWMLPLTTITDASFDAGRAFAVAIALISNGAVGNDPNKKLGHVIWWGHPVTMTGDAGSFQSVQQVFGELDKTMRYGLKKGDPFEDPEYFLNLERGIQDQAAGNASTQPASQGRPAARRSTAKRSSRRPSK